MPVGVIENVMKVSVLVPPAGLGLKVAKTPGGGFNTNKNTGVLNPPSGVTLIVLVAVAPSCTMRLLGEAESKKSGCDGGGGGAFTVRVMVVALVRLPDVPVMVMLPVPRGAVLPAASVKVLELLAGLGLKAAVTPPGKPESDKETLPLKPFAGATVIVLFPLEPCVTVTLLGEAESAKLG